MVEKIESDILIEGEGITAVSLAYFISERNPEKSINLVLGEPQGLNMSHFNPGIILPIFSLPDSLMNKVFQRNKSILEELNSITKDFELFKNPLILLYRGKNSIEKMKTHQEKLVESSIKHRNLSLEEIESYYPFIKTENEIHLTEVYNSYTCSYPFDLYTSFQKLAEENDVYIVKEKEQMKLKKQRTISSSTADYVGREITLTTSIYDQIQSEKRVSNLVKLTTPIFERFPKISVFDALTASFMWLEDAGYFHIFRSSEKKRESLDNVESSFGEIFAFSGKLEIMDAIFKKVYTVESIANSLNYIQERDIYSLNIPTHLELSISPFVSNKISKLNIGEMEIFKQPKALFKLLERK